MCDRPAKFGRETSPHYAPDHGSRGPNSPLNNREPRNSATQHLLRHPPGRSRSSSHAKSSRMGATKLLPSIEGSKRNGQGGDAARKGSHGGHRDHRAKIINKR